MVDIPVKIIPKRVKLLKLFASFTVKDSRENDK